MADCNSRGGDAKAGRSRGKGKRWTRHSQPARKSHRPQAARNGRQSQQDNARQVAGDRQNSLLGMQQQQQQQLPQQQQQLRQQQQQQQRPHQQQHQRQNHHHQHQHQRHPAGQAEICLSRSAEPSPAASTVKPERQAGRSSESQRMRAAFELSVQEDELAAEVETIEAQLADWALQLESLSCRIREAEANKKRLSDKKETLTSQRLSILKECCAPALPKSESRPAAPVISNASTDATADNLEAAEAGESGSNVLVAFRRAIHSESSRHLTFEDMDRLIQTSAQAEPEAAVEPQPQPQPQPQERKPRRSGRRARDEGPPVKKARRRDQEEEEEEEAESDGRVGRRKSASSPVIPKREPESQVDLDPAVAQAAAAADCPELPAVDADCQRLGAHEREVTCVLVANNCLFTAGAEGLVRRFCLRSSDLLNTYRQSDSRVNCLIVTNRGCAQDVYRLFSGGSDSRLSVHNVQSGELLKNYRLEAPLLSACRRWDNIYLGLSSGKVVKFDLNSGCVLDGWAGAEGGATALEACIHAGRRLLLIGCSASMRVFVRDERNGIVLHSVQHSARPNAIRIAPGSRMAFSACDAFVLVHRIGHWSSPFHKIFCHTSLVCMHVTLRSTWLLIGCADGSVRCHEVNKLDKKPRLLRPSSRPITALEYVESSRCVIACDQTGSAALTYLPSLSRSK